jgi:hypothetical protein
MRMGCQIKQQIKILAAVMLLGVNLFAQQYPQPVYGPQGYPQQQPPPGYAPPGQGNANQGPYVAQQYPPPGYRQPPPYGAGQYGAGQYGPQGVEENPDDPTRGVARVSFLQGEVNVRRGDSGELVAAAPNAPLMSQDRMITGPASFAEVQFDAANLIRLAPVTDAGMADLEYRKYQIQLARGTIMYSIVREPQAQVEIDTPSVAIRPLRFGEYRISVFDDGTTQVTVRAGEAEILGPQGSEHFTEGRTMLIRGGPQGPEFQTSWALPADDFDQWNVARDQQLQRSQSYRFVSSDMAGAEDLDQYGQWTPSEYGQAWVPSDMPADWAPYRDGQWSWEDYYGWTWVDSAPWGWAPFHYGRWFQMANHAWAWAPLALRGAASLWRPALVGFFGLGGIGGAAMLAASAIGSLFSLFGNLGWSPLAPNEPFHAWYGRGYYNSYNRGGFGAGNIVRGANIAGTFRNARFGNGVSYASAATFGNGQQHFLAAGANQLTQAGLVRGPLPLAPTRQSLAFSGHAAYSNAVPAAGGRAFFSRMQGTAVSRVPFATQSGALQRFSQQTLGTTFNRAYAPGPGAGKQAFTRNSPGGGGWPQAQTRGYNSSVRSTESNASGWHAFGQTNGDARGNFTAPRSSTSSTSESSGWHVFGQPHQSNEPDRYRSGSGNYGSGYAAPQGSARGYYGGASGYANGNGQPLRLNQPMVQPRGYGYQNPGYSGSRNYSAPATLHYNYSAPKYSAPKYSAPRYSAPKYSAPKSSGGGSHGGGSHGGGGHAKSGGHHK